MARTRIPSGTAGKVTEGAKKVAEHAGIIGALALLGSAGEKMKTLFDGLQTLRGELEEKEPELIHEAVRLAIDNLTHEEIASLSGWCNTMLHFRKLGAQLGSIKHKGSGEKREEQSRGKDGLTKDERRFVAFLRSLQRLGEFNQELAENMLDRGMPVKGDRLHRLNESAGEMREQLRASAVAQEKPARWWR